MAMDESDCLRGLVVIVHDVDEICQCLVPPVCQDVVGCHTVVHDINGIGLAGIVSLLLQEKKDGLRPR